MKKHQKHTALQKPQIGRFGKSEWAILGAPCGLIQTLSSALNVALKEKFNVVYMDADHASADHESNESSLAYYKEYVDKINYHQFNLPSDLNDFDFKESFKEADVVLVNGNHFPASRQIVIIDPIKEKSLKKRLDQLSNIDLILIKDNADIFSWLKEAKSIEHVKVLDLNNTAAIVEHISTELKSPILEGLVLAGGKSQRMGRDKGLINYHGLPQRNYLFNQLSTVCGKVHFSFAEKQSDIDEDQIIDTFTGLGPFGAILSAFRSDPNKAYFAVACDYPNLDMDAIQFLIDHRDPSKIATCFYNPATSFPEPTITIWEPKAYQRLLYFLSLGYACPRKVLINSNVHVVEYNDISILKNVNTPEEYQAVKESIEHAS
ncbi:MAG: NTP transferase domain-containing protein [Bacteroidota bacterium]